MQKNFSRCAAYYLLLIQACRLPPTFVFIIQINLLMKTKTKTPKQFIYLLAFIVVSVAVYSCDAVEEIINTISESEAAAIVEGALQSRSGEVLSNIEDAAEQLVQAVLSGELCDTLYQKTVNQGFEGSRLVASYSSDIEYMLTCNSFDLPETGTFSGATNTTYTMPNVAGSGNGSVTAGVTGLELTASSIVFNGSYVRTGTQEVSVSESKTVNSTLTVAFTDVTVSKVGKMVESGSASFSLSGSTPQGEFVYEGTIVFNGEGTATVTINGNEYTVSLN